MRIFSLKKPKNKNPIFNGLIKIIRKTLLMTKIFTYVYVDNCLYQETRIIWLIFTQYPFNFCKKFLLDSGFAFSLGTEFQHFLHEEQF